MKLQRAIWKRVPCRHLLGIVVIVLVNTHVARSRCEEPPVSYRRVLVPADSPAAWPRDGEKFLPIESQDFDTWVAAANQPQAEASLVEAEYEARLAGQQLVGGRGRWQVALRGKGAARLSLGTPSLFISQAKWLEESQRPAQIGWWPAEDRQSMTYGLWVPQAGEVEFAWQPQSANATAGSLEFPFRAPLATKTRLILQLPLGKRPVMEGSVVESTVNDGDHQRWVLAVGALASSVLRIEDTTIAAKVAAPIAAVEEHLRYEITKHGLELLTTLEIAAGGMPIKELNVTLPKGSQLVEVCEGQEDGDQASLAWHIETASGIDQPDRAVIELTKQSNDGRQKVVLRAWGPLVLDEFQQLPKLKLNSLFWSSGTIELVLDESLQLQELTPVECIQTAVGSSSSSAEGKQTLAFDSISSQAELGVTLSRRATTGSVRMSTAMEVGNSGVTGRMIATFGSEQGELLALTAKLRPEWSIDAVESIPAGALAEWYVDDGQGMRTIQFQLSRPAISTDPITIAVTGRLNRSSRIAPQKLDELGFLDWLGLTVERDWLCLKAVEPNELELIGDLQPMAMDELPTDALPLETESIAGGQWLDRKAAKPDAAVRLTVKQGTYDAEIEQAIKQLEGQVVQEVQVVCQPSGSGIDHVLVHLSEPSPEPLRWFDVDSGESLIAEKMPASDPRMGGLPPGGELWLLHLGRLYARPIALSATVAMPFNVRRRMPLVSLPDATTQRGRVKIVGDGISAPAIVTKEMTPSPLPVSPNESVVTQAVYRYQPTRFYDAAAPPELWLGASNTDRDPNGSELMATFVTVESHYAADGSAAHRLKYELDNRGASDLELAIPAEMRIEAARIEGVAVAELLNDATAREVKIPLLSNRQKILLELELQSQETPLAHGGSLPSPLPTSNVEVLRGEWTIWLPHDYIVRGEVMTTSSRTLDWRERLLGPLAQTDSQQSFNPLSVRDWNALFAVVSASGANPALAANTQRSTEIEIETLRGWHPYHVDFVTRLPAKMVLCHQPAIAAWALIVFLATLFTVMLCKFRAMQLILIFASVAGLALLLPITYAPLATAAVLGLIIAGSWRCVQRVVVHRRGLTALAVLVGMAWSSSAQAESDRNPIQRVLVPANVAGQPTGTKVFVSEEFLRRLLQSSHASADNRSWLLKNLECRGEFTTRSDQPGIAVSGWSLRCEIEVLVRDVVVKLPLVKNEAAWGVAASLDGIPVPIDWEADGIGCSIRVAEPGSYRLSIPFVPRTREANQRSHIELSLPPMVGGIVRLTSPLEIADLSVQGISLKQQVQPNQTVWEGVLDGSGRLNAAWTSELVGTVINTSRRIDEFLWLQIEPDGVDLSAKYVLRAGASWPDTIDVIVDHHWQLLHRDVHDKLDRVSTLPDGRQTVRVGLQPSEVAQPEIQLRFRLRKPSSLGRLRAPTIELASLAVENRWLAISCDSSLECAPSDSASPAADVLTAFPAAWGAIVEANLPQYVFNAVKLGPDWNLAIRPRPTVSTSRDRLSLIASRERLRLRYQSSVMPQGAGQFVWSLTVPGELTIESLVAEASGQDIPLNWVRTAPNRVNVFFSQAVREAYELTLDGSLPLTQLGRTSLPCIQAATQPALEQTVTIYRNNDVLVAWEKQPLASSTDADVEVSTEPSVDDPVHFVRACTIDSADVQSTTILIEPNDPKLSGELLTSLKEANGIWAVTVTGHLRVEQGEIDELRFEVPTNWLGPYKITPAANFELVTVAEAGGPSTLIVALPQPLKSGDAFDFEISSPLAFPAQQSASAPRIVPLMPGSWQTYLSLPKSVGSAVAEWTHTGAEPVSLPTALRKDGFPVDDKDAFRLDPVAMNISLRPRPMSGMEASIRLAETTVHVGATGGRYSETRFVIAPQGLTQCVVEMPASDRLLRASLDGHPAIVKQIDPFHWHVQLGPPNLPQVLEIVSKTTMKSGTSAERIKLSRPTLQHADETIPVELNLWSLCLPASEAAPRVTGAAVLSPAELASLRFDRLVSISQAATGAVLESPAVDGHAWFINWSAQLLASEQAAKSYQHPGITSGVAIRVTQPTTDPLAETTTQADAWIDQLTDVFGELGSARDYRNSPTVAASTSGDRDNLDRGNRYCFISEGSQDSLRVDFVSAGLSSGQARLAALASIAVLAIASLWLLQTPAALDLVRQWPEAAGVVGGVAAWAWLRPSILGLAVVAVSGVLILSRWAARLKSRSSL